MMIVAAIALGIIALIVVFRTLGLAVASNRGVVGDAWNVRVRLRMLYYIALIGGSALFTIGGSIGVGWLFDIGLALWAMTVPLLVGQNLVSRRHVRNSSKSIST
jgi:hypothetical protein